MLSEFDRPFEATTLLDLVSYPDLDEPEAEESIVGDGVAHRHWRIFALFHRSRPATRLRKWLRIERLRRFRARLPRLDVA